MRQHSSQSHAARIFVYEKLFRILLFSAAAILIGILIASLLTITKHSWPSISKFGLGFLVSSEWNPVTEQFGAVPFVLGTIYTTILALLISTPFSIGVAIFLSKYLTHTGLSKFFKSAIELLAGIPSVIYGFWGLVVVVPLVRELAFMFGAAPYGVSILAASIVLAIMIIPYSAAIAYEVMHLVPQSLEEASYGLGATKMETVLRVVLPTSASGIFSGIVLATGRALGETMAVTMVIGNRNAIATSIFEPANTIASVIANDFAEATEMMNVSALIELGLILFVITTIFSLLGQLIVRRWAHGGH